MILGTSDIALAHRHSHRTRGWRASAHPWRASAHHVAWHRANRGMWKPIARRPTRQRVPWHVSSSFQPAAGIKLAKAELEDVARHIRTTAPELAAEWIPAAREAIQRTAQSLVPARRRRSRRWPVLLVAGLVTVGVALLIARKMATRRSTLPMPLTADWAPSGPGRPGAEDLLVQRPPAIVLPDATGDADTFDRDAGIRAASEGMEAPEEPGLAEAAGEVAGAGATDGAP